MFFYKLLNLIVISKCDDALVNDLDTHSAKAAKGVKNADLQEVGLHYR